MGQIHTVGPNEAVVVSGGVRSRSKRAITGGWVFACACITEVQHLSLQVFTIRPKCENVETRQGVAITVSGIAQVMIRKEQEFLKRASEVFLGKRQSQIASVLLETLEGHLRAIIGSLSVEEILRERRVFANQVHEFAATEMAMMGVEILSFTIKEISDNVNYLDSIGKTEIANVKKVANIGVAEAERDAGINESENDRITKDQRFVTDTSIADSKRDYDAQKAEFDEQINSKEAEAGLAFTLQSAKENQKIRAQEIEIEVIERRKLIEVEEKEILRRDKELEATVKLPAEAESYKLQILAEGKKKSTVHAAQAEAERIKLVGDAEAASIAAKGKAEAEKMSLKAASYKAYGNAAVMSLILEAMPAIAAEIAAPLEKINEVLVISDDGSSSDTSSQVSKLLATLPPSVKALTGVDLKKVVEKLS